MKKLFTGEEFVKALAAGTLRDPILKEGMVKPSETSQDEILFADGMSCQNWTVIPVDMIESVEFIANERCQDHHHPYVRLFLKEPAMENRHAGIFAELLRQRPVQSEHRTAAVVLDRACYQRCIRQGRTPQECFEQCISPVLT